MYIILDYFFTFIHGIFIIFITTSWIFKKTRKLHFISISLTMLSWFGLGIFFGWGYCPCTDWHWQVKRDLSISDLHKSYINYYLDQIFGFSLDQFLVDLIVVISGIFLFILSFFLNFYNRRTNNYS